MKGVERRVKKASRREPCGCQMKGVRGTVGARYNVVVCCGLSEFEWDR